MVEFDVFSDDPEDQKLVARYWAMDAIGNFVETVAGILPYREISKVPQLVRYINDISAARDLNQVCPQCDCSLTVRSRSDVKGKPEATLRICSDCREFEERGQREKAEAEKLHLRERLTQIEQKNLEETSDYSAISDDLALLLVALERAIKPRLLTGSFARSDCRNLSPVDSDKFVQRLWQERLIVDIPSKAQPDAYFLKEERVWHYSSKVSYVFVPDSDLGKNEDSFCVLEERRFSDYQALRQLWLDYSLSDCMAYLHNQSAAHGLQMSSDEDGNAGSILRTALETYSVAQLWSVIWKVVRDAASLSTRDYYNQTKAAATIPGKLKRHLELVAKGSGLLKVWDRPVDQAAGTLGDVFYEYFGIDENTPGATVRIWLSEIAVDRSSPELALAEGSVETRCRLLMQKALDHNISTSVLEYFADRICSGDSMVEALDAVFAMHPPFNE